MPAPSAKNLMLSPAFQDLGLGAQLQQQVEDDELERKKKLNKLNNPLGNPDMSFGAASMALLGKVPGYGGQ